MRPAAAAREAIGTIALESSRSVIDRSAIDLRLRPGDERRQAVDADAIGNHRLRLKLRLRTMLAMAALFAGLMLVARLVGLSLALVVALIVVVQNEYAEGIW